MAHTALISGGVRSGKSAFALAWAKKRGDRRVFIATAQAFDDEMQRRIDDHKLERASEFATIEAPIDVQSALADCADAEVVVIDCLTLLISNWLLAGFADRVVEQKIEALATALQRAPFASIIVSNEVGMGIVPDNALSRRFRDLTGRAHQQLAKQSEQLLLAVMGTILQLKPELVALPHA